jgi:hypothetical protein
LVALTATHSKAVIREWIDAHPKVAYSIKWEFQRDNYPDGYDPKETAKVSWPDWSEAQKQALETAFAEAQAWFHSAEPFTTLNETIQYPPTNIDEEVAEDNASPWMKVSADYAWEFYIRWIAQNLLAEYEHHFAWSLLDYDTEMLKGLLDSTSLVSNISSSVYAMSTGSPGHGNYVRPSGNLGASLPAPPRYTYAFLHNGNLIGATRENTIVRLLDWSSQNLSHFYGASTMKNHEDHWQFRGPPPITRIIEGTIRVGEATPDHWTAGCHGTTGFWRNVLRAANIPVQIQNRCQHSVAHFLTEHKYVDHGDDPYNSDFKSLGVSTSQLLVSQKTAESWFGDNPNNNSDYCAPSDKNVARQIDVLYHRVEICDDGFDNDSDGAVDCDDSDCPARTLTAPAKLLASDGRDEGRFGTAAATSGGRVIVGAQGTSDPTSARGTAYIMAYQPSSGWVQEAKLSPTNPDDEDFFGSAVAIDGDTALVGNEIARDFQGVVYTYTRQNGAWTPSSILTATGGAPDDRFGVSTALQGDTAAFGAQGKNADQGAVYVFNRIAGTWQQSQLLSASDAAAADGFGYDVAIDGDVMVVGAYHSSQHGTNSGSAYVFRRQAGTWVQESKLEASDPRPGADFGWTVSVSGQRIMVGAPYDTNQGISGAGAAYVFDYDSATHAWVQTAKWVSPTPELEGGYGIGVSLKNDLAVVGAYGEIWATGNAYVYRRTVGTWALEKKITPPKGILNDRFGYVVPTDGQSVFVGAYGDGNQGYETGALYVYDLGTSQRGQCVKLTQPQTGNPNVTVTFPAVNRAGTTQVTTTTSAPPLPVGFKLGDPATYYEITTTTDYSGSAKVCIDYTGVTYTDESALKLLHYENGVWNDLCATPTGCQKDAAAHTICALSSSLSPFAVAEMVLFPRVDVPGGNNSAQAIFLPQSISQVGDRLKLDVYLRSPQPSPSAPGQVQLLLTMEREGINNQSLGTVQLGGLPLNAWSTVTFPIPAAIRTKLLGSIAAGRFIATVTTPSNAPKLTLNNLRFAGNLVTRSATAPQRSSIPALFSFEALVDWSAQGATLSIDGTRVTDRVGSIRLSRSSAHSVVRSADFFTNELSGGRANLALDLYLPSAVSWGSVQAFVSCPFGQDSYIGQSSLTSLTPNAYSTLVFAIPASVVSILNTVNRSCSFSFTIDAPTPSGDFYMDRMRLW